MSNRPQNQYNPDYVSPPGETLLEVLEERSLSQADLAERMGRPKKTVNEIIQGKTAITPETAIQLERTLDVPASFWLNREQQYRQYLARQKDNTCLADQVHWLQAFPIKIMIERGWLQECNNEVEQLVELLTFFGVASSEAWEQIWEKPLAVFRKTAAFESSREDVAVWLRRGEMEAQMIHCELYDAQLFQQFLDRIRGLTRESPEFFQPAMVDLCSMAGVAVVFVPELPKSRISGATRWLTPHKALIQLSLRYKKDDHFWFTFFHEAAHILLHGKRDMFLENDNTDSSRKEQEANGFAAKILIPPSELTSFLSTIRPGYYPSKKAIKSFAGRIGVAPGIVVGRLQHEGYLPYTHCNDLKQTFIWIDEDND